MTRNKQNADKLEVEKQDNEERRSNPGAFFDAAADFHSLVSKIGPSLPLKDSPPEMCLPFCANALHAAELYLKAFLLCNGVSIKTLQNKYGHDLVRLYKDCKEEGLNIISKTYSGIEYLNTTNEGQFWRYPVIGGFSPPAERAIKQMLVDIKEAVKPSVVAWLKAQPC